MASGPFGWSMTSRRRTGSSKWSRPPPKTMLHDFPVAVTMGTERYVIICRDVPTAVFFYQYPEKTDLITDWIMGLLTRVSVAPVLTLEHVQRLDEGSFE